MTEGINPTVHTAGLATLEGLINRALRYTQYKHVILNTNTMTKLAYSIFADVIIRKVHKTGICFKM